jgi:hypothetical protein
MRGPLAVIRDRLAVNLASPGAALSGRIFSAGGRIFRAGMREPRTAGRAGRAVMRGQGPRHIGSKTAEIRQFFKKSRKSAYGGGGAGKGQVFHKQYGKKRYECFT